MPSKVKPEEKSKILSVYFHGISPVQREVPLSHNLEDYYYWLTCIDVMILLVMYIASSWNLYTLWFPCLETNFKDH